MSVINKCSLESQAALFNLKCFVVLLFQDRSCTGNRMHVFGDATPYGLVQKEVTTNINKLLMHDAFQRDTTDN